MTANNSNTYEKMYECLSKSMKKILEFHKMSSSGCSISFLGDNKKC